MSDVLYAKLHTQYTCKYYSTAQYIKWCNGRGKKREQTEWAAVVVKYTLGSEVSACDKDEKQVKILFPNADRQVVLWVRVLVGEGG